MAGIGVRLNKIYGKNTLTTDIVGVGYSTVVTIAPMLVVIGAIVAMEYFLGFSRIGYRERELFSSTILYIFIFSLLTAAPFNSVLSRYMSDVIYNESQRLNNIVNSQGITPDELYNAKLCLDEISQAISGLERILQAKIEFFESEFSQ